jgi:hypothetical protein
LSPLRGHPALKALSLSDLLITEVGDEILVSMSKLETVDFGNPEYTIGALSVIGQRRPGLKVDRHRFG